MGSHIVTVALERPSSVTHHVNQNCGHSESLQAEAGGAGSGSSGG